MHKAKRNIITTLISQLVATACGVVIPGMMINAFGSVMYGLSTSITQFLSYISLLEGGIARVARAELYVPLAQKNDYEISRVYHAIRHFFTIIGIAFVVYTLFISVAYYDIAQVSEVGREYIFFLVWIISVGTLAKYLGGLSNLTLINADQKQYVGNLIISAATLCNVLLMVILIKSGCDLLFVKIGSSIIYVVQPICYALYVRKNYNLISVGKNRSKLQQKWTGVGQHIAYFLHSNTDVVILTLFADLRYVAVYSVYRLVITSIRNITGSFSSGMEAAFGAMLAKKELQLLRDSFLKYKYLLSFVSAILFGTTALLIVPFVRLYTKGISDADYIQPVFAMVLLFSETIESIMYPCCCLPISANKLSEAKWGSYGEAIINIVLSLLLVHWHPLIGVALATLIATVFKTIFYMRYVIKNILYISCGAIIKNSLISLGIIVLCAVTGIFLEKRIYIENYFEWIIWGIGFFGVISLVTAVVYVIYYPTELKTVLKSILHKFKL